MKVFNIEEKNGKKEIVIRTEKQKRKFNISKDPTKYLTICETSDLIKRMGEGKKTYIQIGII